MNQLTFTIISWNFKISHIYINAILFRYRIEIILSCLIDLNFPLPIDIYHLPSPYNFLKIISRSIPRENRKTIKPRLLRKRFFVIANFFAIGVRIRHSNKAFQRWKITRLTATRLFDEAHGRLRRPQLQFSPERDELWTIEFGQYRGFQSATDRCAQTGFCPVVIRSNQRATVDCFAFRIVLFSLFWIDVIILHTIHAISFFFFFWMKKGIIFFK